jgi:tetratricopeptide (TPR) repeat protein
VKPISRIQTPGTKRLSWLLLGAGAVAGLVGLSVTVSLLSGSREQLRSQAEAAARSGDWARALKIWREINSSDAANGLSHLGEARAALALGRALQSEQALRRSVVADQEHLESWQLLLQILRVEDRTLDASRTGWEAYGSVRPESRAAVLKELTLGLLAELPDDDVRKALRRWTDADKNDLDARIALIERIALQPRAGDSDRETLLAELESMVAEHPDHIAARQALVTALADAGEPERGRAILGEWPASGRDSRYWRLRGRWDLEYDNRPAEAATAFRSALEEAPQDWRSWYRLARALRAIGRDEESRQAAETVSRIRGALDPLLLRPLLDESLGHLGDKASLEEIAGLCKRAGLARLGEAWHGEARVVMQGAESKPR